MWNLVSYEQFVYSLPDSSPHIISSNLVLQRRGKFYCWLTGTIHFTKDVRLEISEVLDFSKEAFIKHYGYEVHQQNDELYWYDSQAHPNDLALQSTHPHHKHIPPDIKHHRVPAPNLSFEQPNLPFLIQEIVDTLLS